MAAKEIVFPFSVLPGFAGVDRNTATSAKVECRPAMITGDLAFAALIGQRKTNREARRDSRHPAQAHEKGMEIGTVPAFGVAGKDNVAPAPALARFVIFHVGQGVIVDGPRLFQVGLFAARNLFGNLFYPVVQRYEPVRRLLLLLTGVKSMS